MVSQCICDLDASQLGINTSEVHAEENHMLF